MDEPKCPKCNSPMVKRFRRVDGVPFYGCSRFPDCRGTVSIEIMQAQPVDPELLELINSPKPEPGDSNLIKSMDRALARLVKKLRKEKLTETKHGLFG